VRECRTPGSVRGACGNGYLTVDVPAFDPDYALTLAKAIVKACGRMSDDTTARARQDALCSADH
jgi:capsule polysaccharide export protein KpsE/RkpR